MPMRIKLEPNKLRRLGLFPDTKYSSATASVISYIFKKAIRWEFSWKVIKANNVCPKNIIIPEKIASEISWNRNVAV